MNIDQNYMTQADSKGRFIHNDPLDYMVRSFIPVPVPLTKREVLWLMITTWVRIRF